MSTPTPPRAFMGNNEHLCRLAIRKMAGEQRWMACRNITVEDFRQLFVPAEYREHLKVAFSVADLARYTQQLNVRVLQTGDNYPEGYPMQVANSEPLVASFTWDRDTCSDGFFAMADQKPSTFQPDAPQELVDKFLYVSDNLLRISYEFGLVSQVFEELNINGYCNTPQQMRFVWPAIRHIVDKAGIRDLNLVDASPRAGDRARVPPRVSPHLAATVHIVNRVSVMGEIDMSAQRPFGLSVNTPTFRILGSDGSADTGVSFHGLN